jgi:hypothetical protein
MNWLLIFYLANGVGANGGPATAQFGNLQACEQAGKAIEQKWPDRYKGHLCVHLYAASNR